MESCFRSSRWQEIWYRRDRRPPLSLLSSNASYLPVSLFITPSPAPARLSDVGARVSPNLQGAGQGQHLFYISQFCDGPAPSHLLLEPGKLEAGTGGKATSSFIIFTEGSVFCPAFSKNHPQHLIISRHGKLGRLPGTVIINFNWDRNYQQQNVAIFLLYLLWWLVSL